MDYCSLRDGHIYLYIPIWLNSNSFHDSTRLFRYMLYIPIWLNSNSQMYRHYQACRPLYIPIWLNSNLGVSKYLPFLSTLYIPIWLNSNHTVYAPCYLFYNTLHSNLVKFKSTLFKLLINSFILYIPIWLNSNKDPKAARLPELNFTFQSG